MEEIWKDIKGFPGYQVSSTGFIRSFRDNHGSISTRSNVLSPRVNKDGYYELTLYTVDHKKITKRVHRLVANAFLGEHPSLVVNHINGQKLDNRIENLEFVTPEQNSTLASEMGLYRTTPVRIIETGEVFSSLKECGNAINYHPCDISRCLSGKLDSIQGLHFEQASKNELDNHNKKRQPFLYPHQEEAIDKMFDGCILKGGVGSGKSRTGLFYYFKEFGGQMEPKYMYMKDPCDLYIITTAKKRNDKEWEAELAPYLLSTNPEVSAYKNTVVVDSWQNIQKYVNVSGAMFLFDEDHVTGEGAWVKAFLKIVKKNRWVILSASPGDKWEDYIAVFIANGFYRNKTEFKQEHLRYDPYCRNFPRVIGYMNETRLIRLRNKILIDMDFKRHTIPHHEDIYVQYDIPMYKDAMKSRWDPYKNQPMKQASELCYVLRRIVNSDESRQAALLELYEDHPKMIVFYSFDYEREILLNLGYGDDVKVAEYSGHSHQPIPEGDKWVYLVNYTAGCEGFNCIKTDTIVFYSQSYSYKTMIQAAGRIDRLNTPYTDLWYYHLKTRSGIDLAITRALTQKKNFNEGKWVKW